MYMYSTMRYNHTPARAWQLERRRQPLNQILAGVDTGVLLHHADVLVVRARQGLDELVHVGIAEVRHAVPRRVHVRVVVLLRPARGLDDAVAGALDNVVRPAGEQVARVDDDGVGDGDRVDEGPPRAADLQAAARVLKQQRQGAVVAVLAGAHLARVVAEDGLGDGRVVQQAEVVVAAVGELVEEVLVGQAQAQGDGAHELHVQVLARREEVQHHALEVLAFVVEVVRPAVGQALDALAPDLHRFLEVRDRGAQG